MLIMLWFTNDNVVIIWFLQVINDVIQSYAQVMPSPVPIVKPLLVQVEFSDVAKLRKVKIDDVLVTILVERWRLESYAFHLFVGECTITLEDVTLQLGLHVDGRPITGPTYYDWEQMCAKYIGVVPLENTSGINT